MLCLVCAGGFAMNGFEVTTLLAGMVAYGAAFGSIDDHPMKCVVVDCFKESPSWIDGMNQVALVDPRGTWSQNPAWRDCWTTPSYKTIYPPDGEPPYTVKYYCEWGSNTQGYDYHGQNQNDLGIPICDQWAQEGFQNGRLRDWTSCSQAGIDCHKHDTFCAPTDAKISKHAIARRKRYNGCGGSGLQNCDVGPDWSRPSQSWRSADDTENRCVDKQTFQPLHNDECNEYKDFMDMQTYLFNAPNADALVKQQCIAPLDQCSLKWLENDDAVLCKQCPAGTAQVQGDFTGVHRNACVLPYDGFLADGNGKWGPGRRYTYDGDDLPQKRCATGTWSCSAIKSGPIGCDDEPFFNHSQCWFPQESPLGLVLEGVQDGIPEVVVADQCKEPPLIFAAVRPDGQNMDSVGSITPKLPFLPPSDMYMCNGAYGDEPAPKRDRSNTELFYHEYTEARLAKWEETCLNTFFAQTSYDWEKLVVDGAECGPLPEGLNTFVACEAVGDERFRTMPAGYLQLIVQIGKDYLNRNTPKLLPEHAREEAAAAAQKLNSAYSNLDGLLQTIIAHKDDIDHFNDIFPVLDALVSSYETHISVLSVPVPNIRNPFEILKLNITTSKPAVILVPPYSAKYYGQLLRGPEGYVAKFESMKNAIVQTSDTQQLLKTLDNQLFVQSTVLAGEDSVLSEQEFMLTQELESTVLPGINTSIDQQQQVEQQMSATMDALKKAVEKAQKERLVKSLLNLATMAAKMATNPFGVIDDLTDTASDLIGKGTGVMKKWGLDVSLFTTAWDTWIKYGLAMQQFYDKSKTFVEGGACKCYQKTFKGFGTEKCKDVRLENPKPNAMCEVFKQHSELMAIRSMGCEACESLPELPSPLDVGTREADMRTAVAELGQGYWANYVFNARMSMAEFIDQSKGWPYSVVKEANKYQELAEVQAAYGRDFTAFTTRYLALFSELNLINARRNANNITSAAINASQKSSADNTRIVMPWRLQLSAFQVSALAEQMRQTMRLVCQGMAYQSTEQYFICTDKPSSPFFKMCRPFKDSRGGAAIALWNVPLVQGDGYSVGAEINAYYARVLSDVKYSEYDGLQLTVENKMWADSKAQTQNLRLLPYTFDVPVPVPGEPYASGYSFEVPPSPYVAYPYPIASASWEAFTSARSKTQGKLRFRVNSSTFSQYTDDYSNMYMRGFMVYLDGIGDPIDKYVFKLTSVSGMQQQYTSNVEGTYVKRVVDFQASPSSASVYPLAKFEYILPSKVAGENTRLQCTSQDLAPIFSRQADLCPKRRRVLSETQDEYNAAWMADVDQCPDRSSAPKWCISGQLADGSGDTYFSQKPEGFDTSGSNFNLPAFMGQWELSIFSKNGKLVDPTKNNNIGNDFVNLKGVYLRLFYQKVMNSYDELICNTDA